MKLNTRSIPKINNPMFLNISKEEWEDIKSQIKKIMGINFPKGWKMRNSSLSEDPEYRMLYTLKFLLAIESLCKVDPKGNVIIPHTQAHTFYEELRRCQEIMKI